MRYDTNKRHTFHTLWQAAFNRVWSRQQLPNGLLTHRAAANEQQFEAACDRYMGHDSDPGQAERLATLARLAVHAIHLCGDFVELGAPASQIGRLLYDYLDFARSGKIYYRYELSTLSASPQSASPWPTEAIIVSRLRTLQMLRDLVPSRIGLAHLDLPSAADETIAIDILYPHLVKSGIIVIEQHDRLTHLRHIMAQAPQPYRLHRLPTGQGLIVRS